ncbi:MAG: fibronectin type III domain-containing protein [Pirellulales bacterium]
MKKNLPNSFAAALALAFVLQLCLPAYGQPSLETTMDGIVTRFYANLEPDALTSLNQKTVLDLITDQERTVLATKYWYFNVNVPVVVSVVRSVDQPVVPFWIEEVGFQKTDLVVKNDLQRAYEVWQRNFDAGHVPLGITGFDKNLAPYFVCVGPQEAGAEVIMTELFPKDGAVIEMKKGAWTYRDWDDLCIEELPESLNGQLLLTTLRGRAWEAHLVGAFRKTPFPASAKPDHVVLTWSHDPRTTQSIQWRTNPTVTDGVVRYRPKMAKDDAYRVASADCEPIEDRLLMNDRYMHQHTAVVSGLKPSTSYVYKVGSPRDGNWSDEAEFTTAPAGDAPFSFIYFGDTHRSPEWGKVLETVNERHPDIAFYTIAGDVVNTGLYRDDWDKFFEISSKVFQRKPVMFSLGNHDEPNGLGGWLPVALTAFPRNGPAGVPPERNYSFRYGSALFLVLDVETQPEVQAKWMEQQLASTDATWRFVMFHFPMYALGEDDQYAAIRRRWEEVFAEHHVDVMLQGHVHYYLRTCPMRNGQAVDAPADGTIYLVSLATSGHVWKGKMPALPSFVEKVNTGGLWYQKIDIDGNRLVYRAHDADGKVFDEFVIEK